MVWNGKKQAVLLLGGLTIGTTTGFHARLPLRNQRLVAVEKRMGDFDGTNIGDAASDEGQALALEFYKNLRLREEQKLADPGIPKEEMLSEEEMRFINRDPFSNRREVISGNEIPKVKFSGQRETSAGFFTGQGQSVYSFPLDKANPRRSADATTPQQRMMESEFNLLGNSERNLVLPGVVALALLSLVLVVGLSGGITDGSDRFDPNDWNAVGEAIEEVAPPASKGSVWL